MSEFMPDGEPCECWPHEAGPYIDDPDDPDDVDRCETCGGWRDRR